MSASANLRGAILDVDGTLVDSNDAHAQAWVDVFGEFGYDIPFDKVRPLIGMGGEKLLPAAAGIEKESPEGKELSERRTELFKARYLPRLHSFPGVRPLLERMRNAGHILVAATSANEEEAGELLKIAAVEDLVEAATNADDAERSKPDPDIVTAAMEKCGCKPEHTLLLGDTPYDIDAGRRAGIPVVALRCGGWGDEELAGSIAIYNDPADLLEHFDQSPFSGVPFPSAGTAAIMRNGG